MAFQYYRRPWNESRADQCSSWGAVTYHFEVGDEGCPSRHIEVYDSGATLRYGPGHEEDDFGLLAEGPMDPREEWRTGAITQAEFGRL